MPGQEYYTEIGLLPSVDDPRRLAFNATAGAPAVPDELANLRQEYERTSRVVSVLFDNDRDKRKKLFDLLHRAADRAFRGPNWSLTDGSANLAEVKQSVLDEALSVRSKYLRDYTKLAAIFGIVPLILGCWVFLTGANGFLPKPETGQAASPVYAWVVAALWITAGAAICVWGEFALRMQGGLNYESLLGLDPSRWRPTERLLITVGISFIFAYMLSLNVVQVGFGGLLLNDFLSKVPAMALAVGGVTGLAFTSVQEIIYKIKPSSR